MKLTQSTKKRPKLCYSLPVFDEEVPGNLRHKYSFVERLALLVDVFLIFESVKGDPKISNVKRILKQTCQKKPWNEIQLFLMLFRARMAGCRLFYSHFSIRPVLYAKIITRLFGGKVFLFHCAEFEKEELTGSFLWKRRFYWALRKADYLITASPSMARHYALEFGVDREKIKIVPNWADIARFEGQDKAKARERLGIDSSRKLILFVHQLARSKGPLRIPWIARTIIEKIPDALFLVVGGPGMAQDVSGLLRERVILERLEDVIKLEGTVPNKDMPAYFAAADLYIMPSETEGFPVVLLEAMAGGVPFVATDGGGRVMDLVSRKQLRYVVPAGDMEAFSEKVIELLSDERERQLLIEDGLSHVRRYSTEAVLKIFLREVVFSERV